MPQADEGPGLPTGSSTFTPAKCEVSFTCGMSERKRSRGSYSAARSPWRNGIDAVTPGATCRYWSRTGMGLSKASTSASTQLADTYGRSVAGPTAIPSPPALPTPAPSSAGAAAPAAPAGKSRP